ncbi:MAG: lipid II:glycine glycyltransferase FemX [Candidatus Hodarchaeales archaeon]
MKDFQIVEDPTTKFWNSFLSEFSDGNFEQSIEYGEIWKKTFSRSRVFRLALVDRRDYKKYLGIMQGTYWNYFGFGMGARVRGPLVMGKKEDAMKFFEYLIQEMENYGRNNKILCIEVWVPENGVMDKVLDFLGYTEVGNFNSYIINFGDGIDDLWKNIAHNKRRNIRKAMKKEVEIYPSQDYKDLNRFYSMLEAAKERSEFSALPFSWYNACWDIYPSELSRIFFARWRNKVVSGVFTIAHGDTIYSMGAGSYKEGWKARPNDIIHWKVMEWACENGYKKYNMGLVSEPPPNEGSDDWGIWRWKREWNGSLEKIRVYEKILLPRYKYVLKIKDMVKSGYNSLRQLM